MIGRKCYLALNKMTEFAPFFYNGNAIKCVEILDSLLNNITAMSITISNRAIGQNHKPFVVAEMSGNHNQSLDRALAIVDAASAAGSDAIKLQTFTPDTMTLDLSKGNFQISDPKSLWSGQNLYKLYEKASTPWDWHLPLMQRAQQLGLICFSSPFDESAVDFLEDLGCPAYKIASFENNHLPLISKAASTGKPLIISTGLASLAELEEAVKTARSAGCEQLILLKCTSTYPADPINSNIQTLPHLRKLFNTEVGLSDHTMGLGVSIASVALGATMIEKHFTLSRNDGGVDSAFSLEPNELKNLVLEVERAWQAIGEVTYGATKAEEKSLLFRRSLYAVKNIKAGELFTSENIKVIRPGDGLSPHFYEQLLGHSAKYDIQSGTPINLENII